MKNDHSPFERGGSFFYPHTTSLLALAHEYLANISFKGRSKHWAIRAGRQHSVYDTWSHILNGMAVRNMTFKILAQGVAALLLSDGGQETAPSGD